MNSSIFNFLLLICFIVCPPPRGRKLQEGKKLASCLLQNPKYIEQRLAQSKLPGVFVESVSEDSVFDFEGA